MTLEIPAAPAASPSAVSWAAILAGAVVAVALSLVLLILGSGLGLAAASPWPRYGGAGAFTITAGVWLIITQWLSSAIGGYLTGRLRVRWVSLHTHEVFFRDTAHGLLTWAVATVVVAGVGAGLAASAASQTVPLAADVAARSASAFAIFTALSMLVGAFVACVGAALGGHRRDVHD